MVTVTVPFTVTFTVTVTVPFTVTFTVTVTFQGNFQGNVIQGKCINYISTFLHRNHKHVARRIRHRFEFEFVMCMR